MSDARVYQGAERRSRRLPLKYALLALLGASAIAYATLCPIELRPHVAPANEERLLAFVALGFVLALTFRRRWAQVTVAVMLFAMGLEAVQHFIPGRHGQVDDAIIKALGGLIGSGMGHAFFPAKRAYMRLLVRPAGRLPAGLAYLAPAKVRSEP